MVTDGNTMMKLVHHQLEFLKYVGGKRTVFDDNSGQFKQVPTGQGIDVSIAMLPDLLVDLRHRNIRSADGNVFAVGGRAARTACVLLHLLDEDDDTFSVQLITKTGNLGRLLLQNEFYNQDLSRELRSLSLDHVILREGEPRCAFLIRGKFYPAKARRGNELNQRDLKNDNVEEAIRHAVTIYFSSITNPRFLPLLRAILKFIDRNQGIPELCHQGVFINCEHGDGKQVTNLVRLLKRPATGEKATVLKGLFVSENAVMDLLYGTLDVNCVNAVSQELGVPLIVHGVDNGRVIPAGTLPNADSTVPETVQLSQECAYYINALNTISVEVREPIRGENIPERFVAGVLLASSVRRAIEGLASFGFVNIQRDMEAEWGIKGREWKRILNCGLELATAPLKAGKPPTMDDVIGEQDIQSHLEFKLESRSGSTDSTREMDLDPTSQHDVTELAIRRRRACGHLEPSKLECRDVPVCCSSANQRCGNDSCRLARDSGRARGAVLIDLDSTLLDSTEERTRAVSAALNELEDAVFKDPKPDGASGNDLFEPLVYDLWPLYMWLGLGNFREEWNSTGWYALYLVLRANPESAEPVEGSCQSYQHRKAVRS